MQRGVTSESITKLLRQTEFNLGVVRSNSASRTCSRSNSLSRGCAPLGSSNSSVVGEGSVHGLNEVLAAKTSRAGSDVSVSSTLSGQHSILSAQVSHLRTSVERLESRFERRFQTELQSLTGTYDQRLQAKEDHFQRIVSGMEMKVDCLSDGLTRRLKELENFTGDSPPWSQGMQEFREGLLRAQASLRSHEMRFQQCAFHDDLTEKMLELERTVQKCIDERIVTFEQQTLARFSLLEETLMEFVNSRCEELDQRISEVMELDTRETRAAFTNAVMRRLPDSAPVRELRKELYEHAKVAQVCQQRLAGYEAKLSKLPLIEAKVEITESIAKQQLEDQATVTRGIGEALQQVSAGLAATSQRVETASSKRVDAMQIALETQILSQGETARASEQHLVKRVDDVEQKLRQDKERFEYELKQFSTFARETSENVAMTSQRMEEFDIRNSEVAEAFCHFRQQMEQLVETFQKEFSNGTEAGEAWITKLASELREETRGSIDVMSCRLASAVEELHEASDAVKQESRHAFEEVQEMGGVKTSVEGLQTHLTELSGNFQHWTTDFESMKECFDDLRSSIDKKDEHNNQVIQVANAKIENIFQLLANLEGEFAARVQEWITDGEMLQNHANTVQTCVTGLQDGFEEIQEDIQVLRSRITDYDTNISSFKSNFSYELENNLLVAERRILTQSENEMAGLHAAVAELQNRAHSLPHKFSGRRHDQKFMNQCGSMSLRGYITVMIAAVLGVLRKAPRTGAALSSRLAASAMRSLLVRSLALNRGNLAIAR